jgi:DNA polymerase III delta prime subunit
MFKKMVAEKDIPNMVFHSTAGRGKTSTAFALCNDVGCDMLYVNGSMETSIENLRYKVTQFAMTGSFHDSKKVVIIDEYDGLSPNAQNALKGLMEQVEVNCRFILTTNNLNDISEPILSRCPVINFNFSPKETKKLITAYFKRVCWILDQENVKYDKQVLANFIMQVYPDFRKVLNKLNTCVKMFGEINDEIYNTLDTAIFNNLVDEMKKKKFNEIRKIVSNINPSSFYSMFYDQFDTLLTDECKSVVCIILGTHAYESGVTINKELTLIKCIIELLKEVKWK